MGSGAPDIGPGGCGTWSAFDVPAIWGMLAYEDGTLSVEQALAWDRTYDLLASHVKNLQSLRDGLAERWPPEKNAASAVFLEYLDKLIGSIHPTSYASSTNAVVLSDVVDTLADAKAKVEPLHEQWQATGDPKVQAELNRQAADIMSSTDVAIYQHGQRFVVPPEYEPPTGRFESTAPFTTGDSTSASSSTSTIGSRAGAASTLPRGNGSVERTGTSDVRTGDVRSGLILGGQREATAPGTLAPRSDQPQQVREAPAARPPHTLGIIGGGFQQDGTLPSNFDKGSSRRIGSKPSAEHPTPSPTSFDHDASTAHPSNATTNANQNEGSALGGLVSGGSSGRPSPRRRSPSSEPYTEWPTKLGVPGVLESTPEPSYHDPGPGVIGIDR